MPTRGAHSTVLDEVGAMNAHKEVVEQKRAESRAEGVAASCLSFERFILYELSQHSTSIEAATSALVGIVFYHRRAVSHLISRVIRITTS